MSALFMLKVYCSSEFSGSISQDSVKRFTTYISKTPPGQTFQWTFVIPLLQTSSAVSAANGVASSTDGPYTGPEYCVTLPAVSSVDDEWPNRTKTTVPTVHAELIIIGTSMAAAVLTDILKNIGHAIQSYLCPQDQKVWVSVISRQIPECNTRCCGIPQ